MKDIVIISIYDGVYLSVMVDGIVFQPHARHDDEKETVASVLYDTYNKFGYESGKEFKKMFPNKQIIVCEDGGIKVL